MTFQLVILGLLAAMGPDDFTLVMPVSPETPDGQRRLAQRAMEICAGRYPVLHRYRFTGMERLDSPDQQEARFEVRQEMTCSNTPPAPPTEGQLAPADWQPLEQDRLEIIALTARYFAAVDSGDAETAHGSWIEGQQAETPLSERRRQIEEQRRQYGAAGASPPVRLTWYVNPANAPQPGIYVAVDYERSYANLVLNCGYLIWFRDAAGRYRLTRQENSVFERGPSAPSAEALTQFRQMSRCPS